MKEYNPVDHSIVQASFGSWEQFECDDFIEALLHAILEEIKRVHWNLYQHSWDPTWNGDAVYDPEIPGIGFVRYYDNDCECEDGTCRQCKPNFEFGGVKFKWYKWPGRGMSCNKSWSPSEWKDWFDSCIKHVTSFDVHELSKEDTMRRAKMRLEFVEKYKSELPELAEDIEWLKREAQ